jgi:tRNA (adenine-N(1)-)-methyltransferase non-catalytic subunit
LVEHDYVSSDDLFKEFCEATTFGFLPLWDINGMDADVKAEESQAGPSRLNGDGGLNEGDAASTEAESSTASAEKRINHAPTYRQNKSALSSASIRRRMMFVPARQPVLVRLPNDRLKSIELHPGKSVSLGKYGSFLADDIIGLPYGLTYEIMKPKLDGEESEEGSGEKKTSGKRKNGKGKNNGVAEEAGEVKVVIYGNQEDVEDNEATNELIYDDQEGEIPHAQTMTYLDIKALKNAGTEGRDIVQREVASNSTFAQRTAWSQQKFIMRKEAKHMRIFTPVPPSLTNVMRFLTERYERDSSDRIRGLRSDSLSNMLSLGGVGPGGRYLVVDGVGGLLVGAMLERMGGEGRLLVLNDADSPPALDLMSHFNLPNNIVDPVLRSMHWGCTRPEWQPMLDFDEEIDTTPAGRPVTDRDRQKMRKRKALHAGLERIRQDFFDGQFEGLLIATTYEPASIINQLVPQLGGSSNIVAYSPFLQILVEAQAELKPSHSLISISVTEPLMRRYQVLPGRMHPEMMTSATGGYLLHAIRVYSEDETRALKLLRTHATHETAKREAEENDDASPEAVKKQRVM